MPTNYSDFWEVRNTSKKEMMQGYLIQKNQAYESYSQKGEHGQLLLGKCYRRNQSRKDGVWFIGRMLTKGYDFYPQFLKKKIKIQIYIKHVSTYD